MEGVKSEWIVWAGIAFAPAYIFFGWDFSNLIPVGVGVLTIFFFSQNFIDRSQQKIMRQPNVGPSEPFIPNGAETWGWRYDAASQQYVPNKTYNIPPPPPRQPPNYGGY